MYEFYKCSCGKAFEDSIRYDGMVDAVYRVQTLWFEVILTVHRR
jgi:hypothetical protein